jgi:ectoine hydroxylase-related dioxygenase (phytanoyl-CoA dioxygenase family)
VSDDVAARGNAAPAGTLFHSRFGGLWTDRRDAHAVLADRQARGAISADEGRDLAAWIETGTLVVERAVPPELTERIERDVERAWTGGNPRLHVEHFVDHRRRVEAIRPELRDRPTKVLDLYSVSEAAREAIFAPRVLRFLRLVFEREPMAFQSLYFRRGTQQPVHQDTAFVRVVRPLEFVGSWLALEDIRENSGELQYYEGSHRIPEYVFDGRSRAMPKGYPEQEYYAYLNAQAARLGLRLTKFRPRRGDVVFWHADLAHGGAAEMTPGSTRRSLVTHYCPADNTPTYFGREIHSGRVRHASMAYYCHPLRADPRPLPNALLAARRFAKQSGWRVVQRLRATLS